MFSKAKRFEPVAPPKCSNKVPKKPENEKPVITVQAASSKTKNSTTASCLKTFTDVQSQCSSVQSIKSFATPKPIKTTIAHKAPSSLKKTLPCSKNKTDLKTQTELIKAQEVEIRNKDHTISEYNKQIDELKNEISSLQRLFKQLPKNNNDLNNIHEQLSQMTLGSANKPDETKCDATCNELNALKNKIVELEKQSEKLEQEVSSKQLELSSLEELIVIRDSLCQDLQEKLTNMETTLEETHQRLEMVKCHHALALEANESIRREYKAELETLKVKMEDEKQSIVSKSKIDQENIKLNYNQIIDDIKNELIKEKYEEVNGLQQQLSIKDQEMKAKLEQIEEATCEKLKLCEIQFEERSRNIQEHCSQQQNQILYLEKEKKELNYSISKAEEQHKALQKEIHDLKHDKVVLAIEKDNLIKETEKFKEESKKKLINYENEINKLTVEVDKTIKEKHKFEMSLSVTRDIVQVLTMRLRESDNELEHLEGKIHALTSSKELLENELTSYKNTLRNAVMECDEYKEALVNILKSKAALAKEHDRIMEHNVNLIESLQNVEKEAYRELGSIQNELIEDVELLKKESSSQIKMLREEVEKKRVLCEMAKEHAGQATVAAEQSRLLLGQAATEISRLEEENSHFQQQIHNQQSLVVELSLLRQENEELTMTVAKQSSIIDKMKIDMDQIHFKPKSPSVVRKSHKIGKENVQGVISPLRERNH